MKLVYEFPAGALRSATALDNVAIVAKGIRSVPGIGRPFLAFAGNAYQGMVAAADFDLHPDWAGHGNVVNADETKNAEMIQAMLDNPPMDAITVV